MNGAKNFGKYSTNAGTEPDYFIQFKTMKVPSNVTVPRCKMISHGLYVGLLRPRVYRTSFPSGQGPCGRSKSLLRRMASRTKSSSSLRAAMCVVNGWLSSTKVLYQL